MKRLVNRSPSASWSSLLFAVAVTNLLFGCDERVVQKKDVPGTQPTSAPATSPALSITRPTSAPTTSFSPKLLQSDVAKDRENPLLPTD